MSFQKYRIVKQSSYTPKTKTTLVKQGIYTLKTNITVMKNEVTKPGRLELLKELLIEVKKIPVYEIGSPDLWDCPTRCKFTRMANTLFKMLRILYDTTIYVKYFDYNDRFELMIGVKDIIGFTKKESKIFDEINHYFISHQEIGDLNFNLEVDFSPTLTDKILHFIG